MNIKLVRNTVIITAAAGAGLALFCYNASYNPKFSAVDFITGATPKVKAKRNRTAQETDYTLVDFQLQETPENFERLDFEHGILLVRKRSRSDYLIFLCDADAPDYVKKCAEAAKFLEGKGCRVKIRTLHRYEFTSLAHAGRFDVLLLTKDESP